MIKVDVKDLIRFEDELRRFKFKAFPFATRSTLNTAAFMASKEAQENIRGGFVNRNKFTVNSIRVEKSKTLKISNQESKVGSIAPYMNVQEEGGIVTSQGQHGVPLPTNEAANQSRGARPRTKLPIPTNRLKNIKIGGKMARAKSAKQAIFLTLLDAARKKRKFVFLATSRRAGIFRITGEKDHRGHIRKIKTKMMYNLSQRSVNIRPRPWLKPAFDEAMKKMPEIYKKALEFQIKKHKLF